VGTRSCHHFGSSLAERRCMVLVPSGMSSECGVVCFPAQFVLCDIIALVTGDNGMRVCRVSDIMRDNLRNRVKQSVEYPGAAMC